MAGRYLNIIGQASDKNGHPIAGAKLYFYEAGTTTFANTYSDEALTIANANPAVADGEGRFGDIWLQDIDYRVQYRDDADVLIDDQDPVVNSTVYLLGATGAVSRSLDAKLRDIVSIKDFDAIGDGTTNDTTAAQNARAFLPDGGIYVPDGTYLIDDTEPTDGYFGPGFFKKSYGTFPADRSENAIGLTTMSEAVLPQINPRGWETDGRYAYVLQQGTYNATQQGQLSIIDIQNPFDAKLISSINIGASGETPRALSVYGDYVYAQTVGGLLKIIDVTDKANPVQVGTSILNSGNREYSKIVGDTLIIPKITGNVDFYSLRDPLVPELLSTLTVAGSYYEPIFDGSLMWIAEHSANQLLCVDISDPVNPTQVSLTTLATVKFSRRGVIKGRYLYMGGFDSSSRLNIIDISDATAPTVSYTASTETGAYTEIAGNYLIADTNIYDIQDPISPILVATTSDIVSRPKIVGANIIGLGPGTGAQGPSGNDGNADPTLRVSRIGNLIVPGISAGGVATKELFSDEAHVKNNLHVGLGITTGSGGVATSGRMAGDSLSSNGVIANTINTSKAVRKLTGSISSLTNIFEIHGNNTHIQVNLKYALVDNQALASTAAHTIGMKSFSGYVSSAAAFTARLAVADAITERTVGTASVLTVTITNGAGSGDPITVGVTCPQLSVSNSRSMFEIEVMSSGFGRLEVL